MEKAGMSERKKKALMVEPNGSSRLKKISDCKSHSEKLIKRRLILPVGSSQTDRSVAKNPKKSASEGSTAISSCMTTTKYTFGSPELRKAR